MRAEEESRRRKTEYNRSSYVPVALPYPLCNRPGLGFDSLRSLSFINTTTAIYIFDKRQLFPYPCAMDIESWVWRQWFKPYVSNITLHHFSSIFTVEYDANLADYEFSSEKLVGFHCNNYEQAQRHRDATIPAEENDGSTPAICGPLRCLPWPWVNHSRTVPFSRRASLVIQPLFRAIFMALFYPQVHWYPEDIPKIKVQLVLTGITEGLSAPISFEELRDETMHDSYHIGATTITTTLGAAVPFLMRLEQREITASGGILQPDVAKVRGWNWHREEAKKLGWVEERDGNLDDLTPRSQEWGAEDTLAYALGTCSTLNPLKDSKENWWWDRDMLPEKADNAS
ncbi:hypothetical protein GGR58DRAFT_518749 [Xylaria digitata]|nr:hypothetical protein GGR58DRAFT_518749 [Xylaria digitata]